MVFSLASEPQIVPEALSWHKNLKIFCSMPPDPLDIHVLYPHFHRFLDLHVCISENTWLAVHGFQIGGSRHTFRICYSTLSYIIIFLCTIFASLHERGFLYIRAPHQHANSTPPFRKVWLRACYTLKEAHAKDACYRSQKLSMKSVLSAAGQWLAILEDIISSVGRGLTAAVLLLLHVKEVPADFRMHLQNST